MNQANSEHDMEAMSKAERKAQRRAERQEAKADQPKVAAAAALVKSDRLKSLLNGARVVLIDVGYRGGLQKEWAPACPLLHVVGIEPRGPTEKDRRDVDAGCELTFVERALASTSGQRPFYVTPGSMSSLLEPDPERAELYGLGERAVVLETITIDTTTLDAVFADHQLRFVDLIKLDTQGSELDILRGGLNTLEWTFGLRIEVEFVPLYHQQPLFGDLDTFVRSRGFEFIDFCKLRRRHWYSTTPLGKSSVASEIALSERGGQLFTGDAIYFRGPREVEAHLKTLNTEDRMRYLLGALVVCHVYQMPDYWIGLLSRSRHLLDSASVEGLAALLEELSPQSARALSDVLLS